SIEPFQPQYFIDMQIRGTMSMASDKPSGGCGRCLLFEVQLTPVAILTACSDSLLPVSSTTGSSPSSVAMRKRASAWGRKYEASSSKDFPTITSFYVDS